MKKYILLIVLCLILILSTLSYAQVTITSSKTSIPRGQTSVITLNYLFTITPTPAPCQFTSNFGEFTVGNTILGTYPKSFNVYIPAGVTSYNAIEIVNIPVGIIDKALKMKSNKIEYKRSFTTSCYVSNPAPVGTITLNITTEAAADFDIKRIELYFENRRAEITIPKNYKGLKAFADIKFTGSGLLKGYWEVDGRVLSYVNQHITYGRAVTLQTPAIPPLPTFETGTHIVRFVITNPSIDIPIPSALYFVTAQEVKEIVKIKLLHPEDKSKLDFTFQKFTWEKLDGTMLYLIQFFENRDSKPIFSAYTREAFYNLPEQILTKIFQRGKTYYWKVIGFDESNNTVGESNVWEFSFNPDAFVPGQIIIAISKADFSEGFTEELKRKYDIVILDFFLLDSINSVIVLLRTDKNIFEKIDQLKSESKITLAQPNFIFQTFSEPMRKFQYAFDLMKVDKLHNFYRGKGIKVAIIDTGVDFEHRDLRDRVVFTKNFVKNDSYKKEIHGTAVAGVIGANINNFGICGVAPEAEIYALRACSELGEKAEGRCTSLSIAQAMDEAFKKNVRVINMSFGSPNYDRLLSKLIDSAAKTGVFVVAPVSKTGNSITFPASHPEVISVGGIDEKGNPYPSREITEKAKVLAPAEKIFTTLPNDRHNFLSGVSLSSAYISGLLALYCEKGNSKKLPYFKGNLCKWEEELFGIPLCD